MPKVSASNGIRPEIRALAVLVMGKTVTPAQINDHVGTGDYAAKYVSFLNTRYGFTITANKDGRKVVSYTMIAEPANAADLRAATPKTKIAKPKAKTVKLSTVVKKVNKKFTASKALAAENAAIVRAVTEAENVAEIKAVKVKAPKANITQPTFVPKALGLTMAEANEIREEVAAERALEIKAKNLETIKKVAEGMKKVAAKKAKSNKKTREFDDVTEQFGTSGEVGTSFSVDKDWDSIENLDLSKIL